MCIICIHVHISTIYVFFVYSLYLHYEYKFSFSNFMLAYNHTPWITNLMWLQAYFGSKLLNLCIFRTINISLCSALEHETIILELWETSVPLFISSIRAGFHKGGNNCDFPPQFTGFINSHSTSLKYVTQQDICACILLKSIV